MEPQGGASRQTQLAFWKQAMNDRWDDVEAMAEGSYTAPGQRAAWRRTDPEFAAACAARERDDDLRLIEAARQRAMAGDPRALNLCFRAIRGLARPAPEKPASAPEPKLLPPAVAGAMIEAGLRAMGKELPPLGEHQPLDHPNCPPAMAEAARLARRRFS
jgi:hypothetical protein